MAGLYVDTSALGRVLLAEPDAAVIRATLARYAPRWSSELRIVELRRLGRRNGLEPLADAMLNQTRLVALARGCLKRASRIDPPVVRSLDAIHLAAAVDPHARGEIDAVLTYDHQLQTGCAHHGIRFEAPVV
jgi:hypothetical protein